MPTAFEKSEFALSLTKAMLCLFWRIMDNIYWHAVIIDCTGSYTTLEATMNCAQHIRETADPEKVKKDEEREEIEFILAGQDEGHDFES